LRPRGKLLVVGASMDPIAIPAAALIGGSKAIVGHASRDLTGSEDTLAFSVLSGVRPMIETVPLESGFPPSTCPITGARPRWSSG
jgi:D-arabinose 1-dehydrogenase-like Zn-dependent alcohol dehydrogenase